MDAGGDFAVAWLSEEDVYQNVRARSLGYAPQLQNEHYVTNVVYTRRFDASGQAGPLLRDTAPNAAPILNVASPGFSSSVAPAIAMDAAGNFTVAWGTEYYTPKKARVTDRRDNLLGYSYNPVENGAKIAFQRYDASSRPQGSVASAMRAKGILDGLDVQIAMDSSGDFAVVSGFSYDRIYYRPPQRNALHAQAPALDFRRFHANGEAAGPETTASPPNITKKIFSLLYDVSSSLSDDGELMMSWMQTGYNIVDHQLHYIPGAAGIRVQRFDAASKPLETISTIPHVPALNVQQKDPVTAFAGDRIDLAVSADAGGNGAVMSLVLQQYRLPAPDLAVEMGAGTLPSTILNSVGPVSGTVRLVLGNAGELTAAGKVDVELHFSTDDVFGNGDDVVVPLSTSAFSINIESKKFATLTLTAVLPAGLPAGAGHLITRITPQPGLMETSTANNDAMTALLVSPTPVNDLAILGFKTKKPPGPWVPGDADTTTVQVRNDGTNTVTKQAITITMYESASGMVDGSAVQVGTVPATVTLKPGAIASIDVPITFSDALTAGQYFLVSQLTNPDDDMTDNVGRSNGAGPVAWQFGNIPGRPGFTTFVSTDGGKTITYSLTGAGVGTLTTAADGGINLAIADGNATTAVAIQVTGGDATGTLEAISSATRLKSFTAGAMNLSGDATFTGGLGSLMLRDATGPSALAIENSAVGTPVNITLGRVTDLMLTSNQPIASLSVVDWRNVTDGDNSIAAPTIAKLVVTGNKTGAAGDFGASIALAGGANAKISALGAVAIAGQITGGNWTVTQGNIGILEAGSATAGWNLQAASSAASTLQFSGGFFRHGEPGENRRVDDFRTDAKCFGAHQWKHRRGNGG